MKKILSLILILCMSVGIMALTGCSNNEGSSDVRIAVYNTKYNGNFQNSYPDYILTSDKVLNMIDAGTGEGPIEDHAEIRVLHKLVYYNESGEEITVVIQNIGKVTYMRIGLPQSVHYLTDSELHDVLMEITGANK